MIRRASSNGPNAKFIHTVQSKLGPKAEVPYTRCQTLSLFRACLMIPKHCQAAYHSLEPFLGVHSLKYPEADFGKAIVREGSVACGCSVSTPCLLPSPSTASIVRCLLRADERVHSRVFIHARDMVALRAFVVSVHCRARTRMSRTGTLGVACVRFRRRSSHLASLHVG
jgi:hypothetical protein